MKNKDLLFIALIYSIIVFSGWILHLNIKYISDLSYLLTKINKASFVITHLSDRLDTFESMVQSLNEALDERDLYIQELESQNKLLKDLRSSKK